MGWAPLGGDHKNSAITAYFVERRFVAPDFVAANLYWISEAKHLEMRKSRGALGRGTGPRASAPADNERFYRRDQTKAID